MLPSRVPGADVHPHPARKGRFRLGRDFGRWGCWHLQICRTRREGKCEGGARSSCSERLGRSMETSLASGGLRLSSWESWQDGSLKVPQVLRVQSVHTGESLLSEASGFRDLFSPTARSGSGLLAGQQFPAGQGDWQELLDL